MEVLVVHQPGQVWDPTQRQVCKQAPFGMSSMILSVSMLLRLCWIVAISEGSRFPPWALLISVVKSTPPRSMPAVTGAKWVSARWGGIKELGAFWEISSQEGQSFGVVEVDVGHLHLIT